MGEVAEMMLDGTLCAGCGDLLIDPETEEPAGYPQYCGTCQYEMNDGEVEDEELS
jgi:hypothetical protein